jgi:hypothetical protein
MKYSTDISRAADGDVPNVINLMVRKMIASLRAIRPLVSVENLEMGYVGLKPQRNGRPSGGHDGSNQIFVIAGLCGIQ